MELDLKLKVRARRHHDCSEAPYRTTAPRINRHPALTWQRGMLAIAAATGSPGVIDWLIKHLN